MGLDLLKRANAGGCVTPAILLTTQSDEDFDWAADDAGAAGFLHKHLDMHERVLKHAIRYATRHFQQLQEIRTHLTHVQQQMIDVSKKLGRS
jgi:FixJ family two-component response regulator